MAIVNRDNLIERIAAYGDDDATLTLLEDVRDTVDDFERRIAESGDWEAKYNSLDADWRARYRERFLEGLNSPGGGTSTDDKILGDDVDVPDDVEIKTYEELFSEE